MSFEHERGRQEGKDSTKTLWVGGQQKGRKEAVVRPGRNSPLLIHIRLQSSPPLPFQLSQIQGLNWGNRRSLAAMDNWLLQPLVPTGLRLCGRVAVQLHRPSLNTQSTHTHTPNWPSPHFWFPKLQVNQCPETGNKKPNHLQIWGVLLRRMDLRPGRAARREVNLHSGNHRSLMF